MSSVRDAPEQLRASLRMCQLELAQVRAAQELLMEEHAETLHQLNSTERKFKELSRRVNTHLVRLASGTDLVSRMRRRLTARRRARSEEWQMVRLLRESDLFSGPWYLRQYPRVVSTGLSPAVHYLRHGAAEDLDPGPDFSTRGYLDAHPELAPGTNPLIHHLRAQQQEARPAARK